MWNSYLKKIKFKEPLTFQEVWTYITQELKQYMENNSSPRICQSSPFRRAFLCPFISKDYKDVNDCLIGRKKHEGSKVEYDDIADIHWWMVDHIHYLPAMIYAVLLIDIVSIVVIIKHSKGLEQDEVLERLKIGCSVAVFLLGMLLVYYIAYLFW